MAYSGGYAIVDANEGSASKGKILVLLDDEGTADEIAIEMRHRGCNVVIQAAQPRRIRWTEPGGTGIRRRQT